jgi:hypothetical protein
MVLYRVHLYVRAMSRLSELARNGTYPVEAMAPVRFLVQQEAAAETAPNKVVFVPVSHVEVNIE